MRRGQSHMTPTICPARAFRLGQEPRVNRRITEGVCCWYRQFDDKSREREDAVSLQASTTRGSNGRASSRTHRQLPLLVLGAGSDSRSERGVSCPGELPPA